MVRRRLAELLPGCVSARYQPQHAISRDDVVTIVLSAMPPQAKYLALLELCGMSTQAALDKLGVRREHRSRLISRRRL